MAEVEDMPWASTGLIEDLLCLRDHITSIRTQNNWVQIPHNANIMTDTAPCDVGFNTQTQTNRFSAGLTHQFQKCACARTKMNDGNSWRDVLDDGARVRQHKLAVVFRTQAADP